MKGKLIAICIIVVFLLPIVSHCENNEKRYGLVINDTLIRKGPGEQYESIKQVFSKEELEYTCDSRPCAKEVSIDKGNDVCNEFEYWYEVTVGNEKGWINGSFFYTTSYIDLGNSIVDFKSPGYIFKDPKYEKYILHKGFYFLESIHDELNGWPSPSPDIWLVSKDWTVKYHITTQNDHMIFSDNWSPDDRFLVTLKGIFDTDNNRFIKMEVTPDGCTSFWNRNDKLLFVEYIDFNKEARLYMLDPETGTAESKYYFGDFSVIPTGNCNEVQYGESPCSGIVPIKRKKGHLVVNLFKDNEAWRYYFDENGTFVDKKKLTDCDKHNYEWEN